MGSDDLLAFALEHWMVVGTKLDRGRLRRRDVASPRGRTKLVARETKCGNLLPFRKTLGMAE